MDLKKVYLINKIVRLPLNKCKGSTEERMLKAQKAFDNIMSEVKNAAQNDPPLKNETLKGALDKFLPAVNINLSNRPGEVFNSNYTPVTIVVDGIRNSEAVEMHRMTSYNLDFGKITPKAIGYQTSKMLFDLFNPKAVMRQMFREEKNAVFLNKEILPASADALYFPKKEEFKAEFLKKIKKHFINMKVEDSEQPKVLQDWRYTLKKEIFAQDNAYENIRTLGKGSNEENFDYFANKFVTRNNRYNEKLEVIEKMLSDAIKKEREARPS